MKHVQHIFLLTLIHTCTASTTELNFINLHTWLEQYPNIQYQKCLDEYSFNFYPFPLSIDPTQQPNDGIFDETYVLTIPQGKALATTGSLLSEKDYIIDDFIWQKRYHNIGYLENSPKLQNIYIPHNVAMIVQPAYQNYWHWISEVLCRLAILDLSNIEYDYLCIPQYDHFMKKSIELWGINPKKIIALPNNPNLCIQAENLIIPSLIGRNNSTGALLSCYAHKELISYVRNKLLSAARACSTKKFAEKIFISRKDTPIRNILNEDDVFALLQSHGFERYELSTLSMQDQIMLFHHAKIIVAPQGTCLANTIFCKPETKVFELFQGLCDSTFWYLSQILGYNYTPVQTIPFLTDYFIAWQTHTIIPLPIIENLLRLLEVQ